MKKLKFDYEECVRKGLLRRVPKSGRKAEESIKTAYKWLEEAEKNLQSESFNSCLLNSYLAMFHSARSILYFDGFREKSHTCIGRYLEAFYVKKRLLERKWINLLDHCREIRHDSQYSTKFFATEEEAEESLEAAKEFVEVMNNLLKKKHY